LRRKADSISRYEADQAAWSGDLFAQVDDSTWQGPSSDGLP